MRGAPRRAVPRMWISKQANGKVLQRMRGRSKNCPINRASVDAPAPDALARESKQIARRFNWLPRPNGVICPSCFAIWSARHRCRRSLDPEDLRVLMASYYEAATQALVRFDGHVAQYLGDGLLVYFGYPEAHEDDAQRAVLAGLAILDAVAALNPRETNERRPELAARIGIDTGPVVVGESLEKGADVFGQVTNIAARVQAAAEPDTILITGAVHRLISGMFVVEDRGNNLLRAWPIPFNYSE